MQQGVDERPVRMPRRRVDDHALRLVNNEHICVLIDDVQRKCLRDDLDLAHLRHRDTIDRARLRLGVLLHRHAAQGDHSLLQKLLHGAPCQTGSLPRQKNIDTLSCILRNQFHTRTSLSYPALI